ncbi:MAG: phage portal protein [Phycisphaerales bacterium]
MSSIHSTAGQSLSLAHASKVAEGHRRDTLPRLKRLWAYYRNPMTPGGPGRAYRLAQEAGLPARFAADGLLRDDRARGARELVIENDIGWRVHSMVDFLLGKPVRVLSTAADATLRERIGAFLDAVWEKSGGIGLLQDVALLGHVYGYVDLIVRVDAGALAAAARAGGLASAAAAVRIEVVEPSRGAPVPSPRDFRDLEGYVLWQDEPPPAAQARAGLSTLIPAWGGMGARERTLELLTRDAWEVYERGELVERRPSIAGELPVVHIQNIAQPFRYEGLGEVEPLIPLQDELNTRLSDRAARVTMQSFRMYLARGIDGFEKGPVGPGVVWSSDNPHASIEAIGGDAASPSEESHIREIRDAMDKASAVPPLASGVVQAKIGSLSSANALRVTLMGVLAKTARKRVTYGAGIARASWLALAAAHEAGVLDVPEPQRGLRVHWPDPLPTDETEQVRAAKLKVELGVPSERVLAELGYAAKDEGIAG